MTYLILQMLLCLLAAAAIGTILGWLLRGWLGGMSASAKAALADLQARLGLAEKNADDFKMKFGDVSGKLGFAEKDAADARAQLGDWRMKFESADKDLSGVRSQFLNLQGSMQSARTEWDGKLAASAKTEADLRAQLAALKSQHDGALADHKQSLGFMETQTLGRINTTETQWKARLAKAESDTLDIQRQWEGAEAEIARLKGLMNADAKSDAAIAQKHVAAESAWAKVRADLEAEITRLKAAASEDSKSDQAMVMRFNSAEADWKAKIAASEQQIGALTDDLGRYRSRISSLESDLGSCGSARASLQDELDRMRAELAARPSAAAAPLGFAAAGGAAVAAVAATPAATKPAPAAPREADDLKDIVGIGPVLERQLHAAGIVTFRDLARLTPDGVLELAEKLEHVFGDRITRERWVEQAADLHRKKYGNEP
jgi:predicted flap endonuclease-1-like 5' DNA nuclease